ncbi:hypothetical protein EVAR_55246_1 [Eumeta japonica]|uniref:Uncharacterized protein n=1 Tax=Eumeta variegata TaxID=151549 RepID=A0A4C1Y7U6_EUMVA|nr:hypothetical protein EVAR_55246_1 [Eumeta japonica]
MYLPVRRPCIVQYANDCYRGGVVRRTRKDGSLRCFHRGYDDAAATNLHWTSVDDGQRSKHLISTQTVDTFDV